MINCIPVNLDKPGKNRHETIKKKDRGLKMEPIQLADGVYDVGVIDWNVRDFHGYSTDIGTTYNSFLIVDEKTVLIDTVRKEFSDQLIDNIAAVIDPKKIDYVISNHTELDHSGGLTRVMHKIGEDKPMCSLQTPTPCPQALPGHAAHATQMSYKGTRYRALNALSGSIRSAVASP